MNKLMNYTLNMLAISVLMFKVTSLFVFIGTVGAFENDAIDTNTFIIRLIICALVMLFA